MVDHQKLRDLIKRLERMRGPYMGDGINPGFTTHEVLEFLRSLQKVIDTQDGHVHNTDIATRSS
jgi:hypothetical protein